MKRLVLCFDGTWSASSDPTTHTNVVKLANLVTTEAGGVHQITYYNSGVGTGGPIDRYLGGAFGFGLKSNVKRGLTFLALNYNAGDEIYLFGFSRGAYTARALAGVIAQAGIPVDIKHAEHHWNKYQEIARLQPKPGTRRGSDEWRRAQDAIDKVRAEFVRLARNVDENGEWQDVKIKCVGVWDTVGSYGVPSGFGLRALPFMFTYWTRGFRNTHFGRTTEVGLHAVAIDERRRPFTPTFWTFRPREQVDGEEQYPHVEQVWFAGAHANIGGGYQNCGLSDLSLAWMLAKVQELTGLRFNELTARDSVWPCSACTLYATSRWKWLNPARAILPPPQEPSGLWAFLTSYLDRRKRRRIRINEKVHWSVRERLGWAQTLADRGRPGKYAPANLKADAGAYTDPMALEITLADHTRRTWTQCSMEKAGLPCQCKVRDMEALRRGGPVPAPTTSSPIAA